MKINKNSHVTYFVLCSIGAVYDMIPRCVVTAFVDDDNGRIVADGMDISVKHLQEERVIK